MRVILVEGSDSPSEFCGPEFRKYLAGKGCEVAASATDEFEAARVICDQGTKADVVVVTSPLLGRFFVVIVSHALLGGLPVILVGPQDWPEHALITILEEPSRADLLSAIENAVQT